MSTQQESEIHCKSSRWLFKNSSGVNWFAELSICKKQGSGELLRCCARTSLLLRENRLIEMRWFSFFFVLSVFAIVLVALWVSRGRAHTSCPTHTAWRKWTSGVRNDRLWRATNGANCGTDMSEYPFRPIKGQCECGNVLYKVSAPAGEVYHCHCSRCRRLHGSLFATYAYVRRSDVEIMKGENNLSVYRSPLAKWHFCKTCGCHLFAEHDHNPGVMWYMPATLDEGDSPQHPTETEKHIFVASSSILEPLSESIQQYDAYAPPEVSITSRKMDDTA